MSRFVNGQSNRNNFDELNPDFNQGSFDPNYINQQNFYPPYYYQDSVTRDEFLRHMDLYDKKLDLIMKQIDLLSNQIVKKQNTHIPVYTSQQKKQQNNNNNQYNPKYKKPLTQNP